jgi:hypothetical protein
MKRILAIAVLVLTSVPAMAQYHGPRYNHHHHGYHRGGGGWVAPLLLGGVVGYALTRPEPVVQQPPVIMPPPPVVYTTPNCTVWTETQQPDGSIVRTRTCTQ